MKSQQKNLEQEESITVNEEGSVATAEDPAAIAAIQSAATFTDQQIKYVFKTEGAGGQVTYRVIQVSDGQLEAQTDGAAAVSLVAGFPAATQTVTQAVISQPDGLEGDGCAEAQYAYYPASIADGSTGTMVTAVQAPDALLGQNTPTGQLYVMMSPQEVLTGSNQRTIAPRTQPYVAKQEAPRASRDEKRRAQHNEAPERRSFCPLCSSDLLLAPATHHLCPARVHCLPGSHSTSSRYKLLIEEVTAVEFDARRGNSRRDLKEKSSHQGIIFIYCTLYIP
ncbi:upstream stimulatory factor 1 isoform X2 [Cyprinodon tularosa]|uniref:upstream stimulatory factor 1 isoform X2 n=1 Tax=Cyprinodon tularosa TaxID=77115 RepID=UPI0018E1E68C|nr:upstream stimulatory factor 1 isoform X2 [Cyprinodon tularosa]